MGFLDSLFGKRPPTPSAPSSTEPPATPFPATIATLTPDAIGTLALENGATLRFGATACRGFMPAVGLAVTVTETGPHPLGGFRATAMSLATDDATYRERLAAQMDAMRPPAPPGPPPAAPAPARPPVRPPDVPRLDLPELDAPAPEGRRRLVVFRFENPRPPEVFFRELTLDGRAVRIFAGRAPQTSPTTPSHVYERYGERFATPEEARTELERLVAEAARNFKTQRYDVRLVDAPTLRGLAPAAVNVELERALESSSDEGAARVLADWLVGQGDPRGELAALFQQAKPEAAQAFLAANAERLFGDLEVQLDSEVYDFQWRRGFLDGASLKRRGYEGRTVLAELTRDFLALPVARFVKKLRFGLASYESDNDWSDTLKAVVESPRGPFIRELRFDDYTYEDCEISWTAFGDFSPYWSKLPALEWLHIRSGEGGTLGDVELPNLRTFIRESGGLGEEELRSILRAKWPKLERLDVWFGSEGYGAAGSVELIQPLLDGQVPASLKHLGLINCEFAPELLRAVLASAVLPRLEVLDLSKGVLLDGDVEVLLEQADQVKHLKRLDLSENLLDVSVERLKAALPNVVVGEQREGDEEDRYVAVGE